MFCKYLRTRLSALAYYFVRILRFPQRAQTGVKNQIGKLTDHPTLRWIFQCFQGIHLLTLNGIQKVINLKKERSFILELLPSSCQKYYL